MAQTEDTPGTRTVAEDYRHSHVGTVAGEYDNTLFNKGSYNYEVWLKERDLLDKFVRDWAPNAKSYLDFACGTGRILSFMEKHFDESVGLDISPDMLKMAKKRVNARLVCGDATVDPELVPQQFDCITTFRFFLNAEPALRDQAMEYLVTRLRSRDSVLIFNLHGNRASTYGLSVFLKRLLGRKHHLMGQGEVRRLVRKHGLEIVEWQGINYFDHTFYKYLPKWLWRSMEAALQPFGFLRRYSVYLYFVCRKIA